MSINVITEINVPNVYTEALMALEMDNRTEETRNGKALAFQSPVYITILNPTERVLFDPIRDCNPFFHVAEFIWMMAGSKDVRWIEKFNHRYRSYADPDTHVVHGAYGYRWRDHFGSLMAVDQILEVVKILKNDRTSRRAVLAMWDPTMDLEHHNDLPCNTHIYFRFSDKTGLTMTVCNRSNDLIWGMLGANVVHMTYLHELIAHGAGLPMGEYRVFSNNTHVYEDLPKFDEIRNTRAPVDPYTTLGVKPTPLMQKGEKVEDFLNLCSAIVSKEDLDAGNNYWIFNVGIPILRAYKEKEKREYYIKDIAAEDWRLAAQEWLARRSR